MMAALIAVIALILIVLAASWYFSSIVITPKRFSTAESREIEKQKNHLVESVYSAYKKTEVAVPSKYGYTMRATWLPLEGTGKAVILVHGFTYTRYGSCKYIECFRRLGFSVLMIDQRHHGESGGANTSFGYFEKEDLKTWTDWVFKELGPGAVVGTHGESMGAATVLQNGPLDPRLAFIVADCPFSDLNTLLKYLLKKQYHLPSFPLLNISRYISKLRTGGMVYEEVSPIKGITSIKCPVLFCHGDADDYIPPSMSTEMHKARLAAGLVSEIYYGPGARHAGSWDVSPAAYEKTVADFIGKYVPEAARRQTPER